ncbi:MAG: ATP-binding protein [Alphaproteobacteria bacterium]
MSGTFSLKRMIPGSLLGRSLLIIVMPLVLLQLVSAYVFYGRHWEAVTRQLSLSLAGDIATVIAFRQVYPDNGSRTWFTDIARGEMELEIRVLEGAILSHVQPPDAGDAQLVESLSEALRDRIMRPFSIDVDTQNRKVQIRIQLSEGVLEVVTPRKRLFSPTTYVFVLWMVGTSMFLFAVATLFMRNQVRPIRRLAAATVSFGKGHDVPSFKPEGASEVRQAAIAFNQMRDRIRRQIDQRTEMLAGVSHDLRTPLTRMKLQLAMLDGVEGVAEMGEDVAEMERMIEAYLAFARGEGAEATRLTSLTRILEDVAGRFRRNGDAVEVHVKGDILMPLRPNAIERCLSNLIGNATRYGTQVSIWAGGRDEGVDIIIDDDGPGIPEVRREEVFRAFFRLEGSRNPKTGGVGLGLTIARDVARSHGGDITLTDSPMGGLRVFLRLPL